MSITKTKAVKNYRVPDPPNTPTRIYPIDDYKPHFDKVLPRATEHHFLWMPLMGQHHSDPALQMPRDLCGRTSQAMVYNFFQLAKGGDPSKNYITHWTADKPGFRIDPRFPNGDRAFSIQAVSSPAATGSKGPDSTGIAIGRLPTSASYTVPENYSSLLPPDARGIGALLHYDGVQVLPFGSVKPGDRPGLKARADLAASIARDDRKIDLALKPALDSIRRNHPVVFYGAITDGTIHVITFAGYCRLREPGRLPSLWILVADPAMAPSVTPKPTTFLFALDVADISSISPAHDVIRLVAGEWATARGSLYLLRASALFKEKPGNPLPHGLWMDYGSDPDKAGGRMAVGDLLPPTPVADGAVISSLGLGISLPFHSPDSSLGRDPAFYFHVNESSPDGGFFPVGAFHSVHSGLHLDPSRFAALKLREEVDAKQTTPSRNPTATRSPAGSAPTGPQPPVPVRCLAPGYIVAARLSALAPLLSSRHPDHLRSDACNREIALALMGNHHGVILVRHVLEELPPNSDDATASSFSPKRFAFYSLYSHLRAPDPALASCEVAQIPWLNTLLRSHGSLTPLDPRSHAHFLRRRWLSDSSLSGHEIKGGCTVRVFSGSLDHSETLSLPKGPVAALRRDPDPLHTDLFARLASGRLVTFSKPFLPVGRGDILGFVDSSSAIDRGFLHWELLSPSRKPLDDLLAFAEQKLGVERTFDFFEDKNSNNRFDPEDGELQQLLDFVPDDHDHLDPFRQSFSSEDLADVLGKKMFFSMGLAKETGADKLTSHAYFPTSLHLTNLRDLVPSGSSQLKVRFEKEDGSSEHQTLDFEIKKAQQSGSGPSTTCELKAPLLVPAGTLRILVSPPPGCVVEPGTPELSLAQDADHLRRLVRSRWRNLYLQHLNEWSKDSLQSMLTCRYKAFEWFSFSHFKEYALPSDHQKQTDDFVAALAFWGTNSAEDEPHRLFVDGGGEDTLPKSASTLVSMNPVAGAFTLDLLLKHQKARFLAPPAWRKLAKAKIKSFGWVPVQDDEAKGLRAGEHLTAVALQDGDGDDQAPLEVTLQVRSSSAKSPLVLGRGPLSEGAFSVALDAPFWGKWTLEVDGESGAQALGGKSTSVELDCPTLDLQDGAIPGPVATTCGGSQFSWSLPFKSGCPATLRGWLVARVRDYDPKRGGQQSTTAGTAAGSSNGDPAPGAQPQSTPGKEWRVSNSAVPVFFESLLHREGLELEQGFVVGGQPKQRVSKDFTFGEYGSVTQLSGTLAAVVQLLRDEVGTPCTPVALTGDGLSVGLTTPDAAAADRLRKAVERAKDRGRIRKFEDSVDSDPKASRVLRIGVDETGAGELLASFDLASLFEHLVSEAPQRQDLEVQLGLVFPNGGVLADPSLAAAAQWNQGVQPVEDPTGQGDDARALEAWSSSQPLVLIRPTFGRPTWIVTQDSLQFSVPLEGGTADFWKKADPGLDLGDGKIVGSQAVGADGRRQVSVVVKIADKAVRKQLEVRAKVRNKKGKVGFESTDLPDGEKLTYDNSKATLSKADLREVCERRWDWGRSRLQQVTAELEVETLGVPRSERFLVTAKSQGKGDAIPVTLARRAPGEKDARLVRPDANGRVRATLSLVEVQQQFAPDAQQDVTVVFEVSQAWKGAKEAKIPAVSVEKKLHLGRRKRLLFTIAYSVPDRAFERAAKTWLEEAKQRYDVDPQYDVVVEVTLRTESEFRDAWATIAQKALENEAVVVAGFLATHASKDTREDGLEFDAAPGNPDSTLSREDIARLDRLSWDQRAGHLVLGGCNTGATGTRGWSPATEFAKAQGVLTSGEPGFAYFSTKPDTFQPVSKGSQQVYLGAFRRKRNAAGAASKVQDGVGAPRIEAVHVPP